MQPNGILKCVCVLSTGANVGQRTGLDLLRVTDRCEPSDLDTENATLVLYETIPVLNH